MRQYVCHKTVQAARIVRVSGTRCGIDGQPECILALDSGAEVAVPKSWDDRHKPQSGGYLVRYESGYLSYSPAAEFEAGYSEVTENEAAEIDALVAELNHNAHA